MTGIFVPEADIDMGCNKQNAKMIFSSEMQKLCPVHRTSTTSNSSATSSISSQKTHQSLRSQSDKGVMGKP